MDSKKKKEPKKREKKYEKKLAVRATFEEVIALTFGKKISPTPPPQVNQ